MTEHAKSQLLFLNTDHPSEMADESNYRSLYPAHIPEFQTGGFDHLSLQSESDDLQPSINQRITEGWETWINGNMGHRYAAFLFRASRPLSVFCFGSPTVTGLPLRVAGALSKIIEQQGRFLLTDEAGISSRFQLFLTDDRYPEVALYSVTNEPFINHGSFPTVKVQANWETDFFQATRDAATKDANFGLALYDQTNHVTFSRPAKTDPTLDLTRKMLELGKPVKFFFTGCDAVLNLKTTTDFAQIEAALTEHFS